jgi:hypothetical protein
MLNNWYGWAFFKITSMKKIDIKKSLLLFVSIHVMIAWAAERKKNTAEQSQKLAPPSESFTLNSEIQNPLALYKIAFYPQ